MSRQKSKRYQARGWKTAPISPTCECMWNRRECGAPTTHAYPALGGGWAALCGKDAASVIPHCTPIEELLAQGETLAGPSMSDKTITITMPDIADWRERILWLANAAKHIAWEGGDGRMPEDDKFSRAAMALDTLLRHGETGETASLAVCLMAARFCQYLDDDYAPEVQALLTEVLHDPNTAIAELVANNRRVRVRKRG